jgi:hypothetical protein
MKHSELERLTAVQYERVTSGKFDVEVLTQAPQIVRIYDKWNIRYEVPQEVRNHFESDRSDEVYFASDGYIYFADLSMVREIDIGPDMTRIVNSDAVKDYLASVVSGGHLRLVPRFSRSMIEGGRPDDRPYVTATYTIPGEDKYGLVVSAARKKEGNDIRISVFIGNPETMHFDGMDSFSYPAHLELVKGTIPSRERLDPMPLLLQGTVNP